MEVDRFFDPQSLDLNTLYQQDVDLGVDWLNFEPVKSTKEDQFIEQKKAQVLYPDNFIIDGETGEYLPAPQNNVTSDLSQENIPETVASSNHQEFNIDDCLDFLQTSIDSANGEGIQSDLSNFQGVTDLATLIETTESTVTEPISTTIWDDIATLSELTGMSFDSNDDASTTSSINSGNMHQMQYHTIDQFQNESFDNMTQINQPSDQHSPMKEQYRLENTFPNFPTPPYTDQSESPNAYVPLAQPIHYNSDSNQSFSPTFEETNMTELLLSQQPDLFMGLDNPQIAQQPPTNQVMSPGSWFFGGDEPTGNVNFQQELTDLDLGNEQPGAFLNPPNAPFVPPPLSDSDSGSLADGGVTKHMDVEMMESDTFVKQESQILAPINHNQTFEPQEERMMKEERKLNQRESRDLKKAREIGITLTLDQIINSPVEEYNELLARTPMTAAQQSLVRDIRRRGKNKVAAQNCRKRKIETISSMEIDIDELNMKRQSLVMKQREIEATRKALKSNYAQLYQKIFHSLRDDTGRPYDPSRFTLEQVEGAVILVPRSARRENIGNKNMDTSNRTVAFFDLSKVKIEKEE